MRSNTSLLGRILFWIASEMLEILTRIFNIIFNYNLFRDFCDFCVTFSGAPTQKNSCRSVQSVCGIKNPCGTLDIVVLLIA